MANEILALEQINGEFSALFLFPIATPKVVNGTNVVPTPSVNLPPLAAAALTSQEKAALDDGTLAYTVWSFKAPEGTTPAQVLARARAIYAIQAPLFAAEYTARYQYAGNRYDAV